MWHYILRFENIRKEGKCMNKDKIIAELRKEIELKNKEIEYLVEQNNDLYDTLRRKHPFLSILFNKKVRGRYHV